MPDSKFEILSPAGSLATLKAAVNNGADAVYIGGKSFSARKNAVNFSDEEIKEAVEYAHLCGSKVYVTVNTVISDSELSGVYEFVKYLYEIGTDALIIQDLGVLKMIRESFPDFEIHASTQMTIHNLDGARLAKELGFKRVVLSRELTFAEIRNISENTDIELEVFVHGALCMSYSGQCLMSSFLGARSGNRGACAQPCRLPYTLCDSSKKPLGQKDKYLLSLKDLCLIDEMETLKECGVKSLKIEGRMKSTEYVSLVTSIYSKYRNGGKVLPEDMSALESIFSRSGFTKGYLEGSTGRHMLNYDKNNDDVYNDIRPDVLSRAKSLSEKEPPLIPFDAVVDIHLGEPVSLKVSAGGHSVTAVGTIPVQKALNVKITGERVISQIGKTGGTMFQAGNIICNADDGVSLPVKEINEVRRTALSKLAAEISLKRVSGRIYPFFAPSKKADLPKKVVYTAEVMNLLQAKKALELGFDNVLVHYGLYRDNKDFFDNFDERISLILPPIMRDNGKVDINVVPKRIYATNMSHFKTFNDKSIIADFRLNAYNSCTVDMLRNMGAQRVCLSPELNIRQIGAMCPSLSTELIVYGRIPLMTVQNCLIKSSAQRCSCNGDVYYLKDRKGVYFPVFTDKNSCVNTIYNSAPVYIADRLDEIPVQTESLRFIFTVESIGDIENIYNKYKNKETTDDSFTRGHYYRGV